MEGETITKRNLDIVVPNTKLNQSQIDGLNEAIAYGKENGVTVNIYVGGK